MDRVEHLGVQEAARVEGVNPKTLLRRYGRRGVILANDPEDARRKLVPVSALSKSAYEAWYKAQTIAALQGIGGQPQDAPIDQGNPEQAIVPAANSNERSLTHTLEVSQHESS